MTNMEKLLSKDYNFVGSFYELWGRWKNAYFEQKLDISSNEFNILDSFMDFYYNSLVVLIADKYLNSEELTCASIPKILLEEFDKVQL